MSNPNVIHLTNEQVHFIIKAYGHQIMKKVIEYDLITEADINMGIFVNYISQGFGTSKVGLVVKQKGQYFIQWGNGQVSVYETSLIKLAENNGAEFYIVH